MHVAFICMWRAGNRRCLLKISRLDALCELLLMEDNVIIRATTCISATMAAAVAAAWERAFLKSQPFSSAT